MTTTTDALHDLELMNEKKTAALVDMTPSTLQVQRHRGIGLPYVKIGTRIRYRVRDIEAYLAANTVVPQRD